MRSDHLVFLALVIAAAVVLGTTFGIVNVYKNITVLQKAGTVPPSSTVEGEKPSGNSSENGSSFGGQSSSKEVALAAVMTEDETASYSSMILTRNEIAELRSMLTELGYDTTDIGKAIQTFQKNNGIQISNQLDQVTIDKMIKQVTLKKVKALAR